MSIFEVIAAIFNNLFGSSGAMFAIFGVLGVLIGWAIYKFII